MQMPTLESRVASLEAVQAQINERLGSIEQGQRELSTRMESRLTNMDNRLTNMEQGQRELSTRMESRLTNMDNRLTNMESRLTNMDNRNNSNFKWLVGLLVIVLLANVGTAISVIMALARQ